MADDIKKKKYLAPGTLDATRKNIGEIDEAEALRMTKVLGGEIMTELPFDAASTPLSRTHTVKVRRGVISENEGGDALKKNSSKGQAAFGNANVAGAKTAGSNVSEARKNATSLLSINAKEWNKMNRLMMSSEYNIRPNYGLFNFLMEMTRGGKYKVTTQFLQTATKNNLDHLESFVEAVRDFIQLAGEVFKAKVKEDVDLKYKVLRTIASWNVKELKVRYFELESKVKDLSIPLFVPFERTLYKMLLTVFYLGEPKFIAILKEVLQEAQMCARNQKDKLAMLIARVQTEWSYVCNKIVRLHYPLLMRMCSTTYEPYPDFFQTRFMNILSFLDISKFDLLMKQSPRPVENEEGEKESEKEEKSQENTTLYNKLGVKDEIVDAGLFMLEKLFPKAGFNDITKPQDWYSYFEPIYDFDDGYNMLSVNNPMLMVVVLLQIIEELFQGCRNIKFSIETGDSLYSDRDSIQTVFSEWSLYREVLFDKSYNEDLKTYVNQLYSQTDYEKTQYGKKIMTNILWAARYNFLPHYKFERLLLEQPSRNDKYKPLFIRTDYIRKLLCELCRRIDKAQKDKGDVIGILNPWDKYDFDIPNSISKRLDVLLNAKKSTDSNATNANLLKYTLCIISVLDWWINAEDSPAYDSANNKIYRVSKEDGKPIFSVPLVKNPNLLFAQSIKESMAKIPEL